MRKLSVALMLVMLAGCGNNEPGTDQLAAQLAEAKADRDRLQAQVNTLANEVATLKENAVVNLNGCRGTLSAVVQRMINAGDDLDAKKYEDARFNLDWAGEGINDAVEGDCASAA
jgi:outer membrane murein-binding lipoprotein Lpp